MRDVTGGAWRSTASAAVAYDLPFCGENVRVPLVKEARCVLVDRVLR